MSKPIGVRWATIVLALILPTHARPQSSAAASIAGLDEPPHVQTTPIQSSQSVHVGNPLWRVPLATLMATRERPLFSRTRRPPPPPQIATLRADPPPPQPVNQPTRPLLTLLGAIAADSEGVAILMEEASKAVIRMKIGESYSGWMLQSVEKRRATFQMARQVAVLDIPLP